MADINTTDEITLKELILKIKEYSREVRSKFWILLVFIAIALSYQLYTHFNHQTTYSAKLRFVVEGQSGVGGGLNSLLGSFGIKKGGKVNPYKILEVGKSSRLLNNILSKTTEKNSTVGQEIIDVYELDKKWSEDNDDFLNYVYNPNSDDKLHLVAKKNLNRLIWGTEQNRENALMNFSLDDETGIYKLNTTAISEALSLQLSELLYNEIKVFFEDKIFENQKQSTEILLAKADSLKILRDTKVYELANFRDRNRNSLSANVFAKETVLSQEVSALNIAYGEVLKNYEMTDVNLKDIQPLFMAIDVPTSPLPPKGSSLLITIIKSFLIGGFCGLLVIVLRKMYKEIMYT